MKCTGHSAFKLALWDAQQIQLVQVLLFLFHARAKLFFSGRLLLLKGDRMSTPISHVAAVFKVSS